MKAVSPVVYVVPNPKDAALVRQAHPGLAERIFDRGLNLPNRQEQTYVPLSLSGEQALKSDFLKPLSVTDSTFFEPVLNVLDTKRKGAYPLYTVPASAIHSDVEMMRTALGRHLAKPQMETVLKASPLRGPLSTVVGTVQKMAKSLGQPIVDAILKELAALGDTSLIALLPQPSPSTRLGLEEAFLQVNQKGDFDRYIVEMRDAELRMHYPAAKLELISRIGAEKFASLQAANPTRMEQILRSIANGMIRKLP